MSGLMLEIQLRRTRTQRQWQRPRQRVRQRHSSRSSLSGGRLVPVLRPSLGLVHRASLPPLLALQQLEAHQLLVRD